MSSVRYSSLRQKGGNLPPKPRRKLRFGHIAVAVTLLLIGFIVFKINLDVRAADHAAALAAEAHLQAAQANFSKSVNDVINANPQITFSVSLTDLSRGFSQQFGSSDSMEAASDGKLITAALYLRGVESGKYNLNQSIGDYSAGYQLQQMIQQSDDTAWQAFNDFLGHDALRSYAGQQGLVSYDPDQDTIKAADVASFLQKLSAGKLLDPKDTSLLLSYMQNTNYEDFISPAISGPYQIHHKVGLADDEVNDAAIITGKGKGVVLVIFTDGHGTQQWQDRADLMQQIAKAAINDYLN